MDLGLSTARKSRKLNGELVNGKLRNCVRNFANIGIHSEVIQSCGISSSGCDLFCRLTINTAGSNRKSFVLTNCFSADTSNRRLSRPDYAELNCAERGSASTASSRL
jgi:hypothetical protein